MYDKRIRQVLNSFDLNQDEMKREITKIILDEPEETIEQFFVETLAEVIVRMHKVMRLPGDNL